MVGRVGFEGCQKRRTRPKSRDVRAFVSVFGDSSSPPQRPGLEVTFTTGRGATPMGRTDALAADIHQEKAPRVRPERNAR